MASLKERQRKLRKETINREVGRLNSINEKYVLDESLAKAIFPSQALLEKEISVNIDEEVSGYEVKFNAERIKIRDVLKFIEGNFDNKVWALRYTATKLIGLLPKEIAVEYLPYLAILGVDGDEYVNKAANESWNTLKPNKSIEDWIRELDLESKEVRVILKFIEENWNSKDNFISRYVVAELIGLLPNEITIDYLPYLAVLSVDVNWNVKELAKKSWNNLNPETWVNNMPKEKLKKIEKFIEENWNNENNWRARYAVAKLIGLLSKEVAIGYLPYLAVLSVDEDVYVKKAAKESWKKLKPETWVNNMPKEKLKKIEKFIEENWNNKEWTLRYAVAKLIGLLPKEVAMEHLPHLAILSVGYYIWKAANESWNKLNPNESIEGWIGELDLEGREMKMIRGFIEGNWDNEDSELRDIVAELIGLLPKEVAVEYLPYLAVLSVDEDEDVNEAANESWNKLKPETWVNTIPKEKLRKVEEFIESNWNDKDNWRARYAVAKLIGLLPEEIARGYLPYLAVLSVDRFENVRGTANESWKKLKPDKSIGKWIKGLDANSKEIKIIREHAKELLG